MDQALTPKPQGSPSDASEGRVAELEEALARCARLEERVAGQEELIAVVTHEIRTPLAVIAGFARMLLSERSGPLNDDQRRFVEQGLASCRRLDAFLIELFDGVRPWSPGTVRPRDASLRESLEDLARRFEPLLAERDQRLALEVDAERARFDPDRLDQVLTNLVGNAIRHAPSGSLLEIHTRCCGEGPSGEVEVAVIDRGPGVPEADRERIFEAGVRCGGDARRGLGLGLAIARRIVEALGGRIRVEPGPGGGSRFSFTLPGVAPAEGQA